MVLILPIAFLSCGPETLPPKVVVSELGIEVHGLAVAADNTYELRFRNDGEDPLNLFTPSVLHPDLVQITIPTTTLEQGDSVTVTVTLHPPTTGLFTDTITFVMDDPDNRFIFMPVLMTTLSYDLIETGWPKFEAANYAGAAADFAGAITADPNYAECYTGHGWASLKTDNVAGAVTDFASSISLGGGQDARAGKAFADLNSNNQASAITNVDAVVTISGGTASSYTFAHDATVTEKDLLWIKARAHFLLAQYSQAQTVVDILSPSNGLDSNSQTYVEDLAALIESLRSTI